MVSLEFVPRITREHCKKKQPLFKRETVGLGLLTLALLII